MTHHFYFYADQLFFSFVKRVLEDPPEGERRQREVAASAILACSAALEGFVNSLFQDIGALRNFDELRLLSKLETLADWHGAEIDWGTRPWQTVAKLVRIRNWLTHFKSPLVGFTGTRGGWIVDERNPHPKLDPKAEITFEQLRQFYEDVRAACRRLLPDEERICSNYAYLESEDYQYFMLG